MFTFPVSHFGGNALPLSDVISSACWDLDATLLESFISGQVWKNVITSPADSAAQAAYNFLYGENSGIDTDDPTHIGGAGNPTAYNLLDGGDFWRAETSATTDMITINSLHHGVAGHEWWVGFAFRFQSTGVVQGLFYPSFSIVDSFGDSVTFFTLDTDELGINRRHDTSGAPIDVQTNSGITLVDGTDYLILITRDEDTDSIDFFVNSKTISSENTVVWAASTTNAGIPNTPGLPALAARNRPSPNVDFHMVNETRFRGFYGGNSFIGNAEAENIVNLINSRHRILYA